MFNKQCTYCANYISLKCFYTAIFSILLFQCAWLGSSYNKMVKEYKSMLRKCQLRHGVDRPKTPFSIREMIEYLDMRRRKIHF